MLRGQYPGVMPTRNLLWARAIVPQGTAFIGNYSDQKVSANFNLSHTSTNQKFHLQLKANYVYDDNNLPISDPTSTSFELAA